MYLENFLNESTSGFNTLNVEPLFESYITGEDSNELEMINYETSKEMHLVAENGMFAESLAYVAELQGNHAKAVELQESVVGNVFTKIKDWLVNAWRKVKAFFVNLFKGISVSVLDIKKSLKDINKYLDNKDFSKYSYNGYKWANTNIAQTISANLTKSIDDAKSAAQVALKRAENVSKIDQTYNNPITLDKNETEMQKDYNIGALIGKGNTTMAEAANFIEAEYGCNGAPVEITNFSETSWKDMVSFLTSFENNKILTNLKKDTDTAYGKAITAVDECAKKVEALKVKGDDAENKRSKFLSAAVKAAKANTDVMTSTLASYNSLMGYCISAEKKKFKEFRGAISGAVRYNPKKSDK